MSLSTKIRITNIIKGCRTEFQYLYVWNEPYVIVDASFFIFGKNRNNSLKNLREYIYKLWYINTESSYLELSSHIVGILNKKVNDGIFITESDVYKMVYEIMNSQLPKDINVFTKTKVVKNKRIETTSKIEWKDNVNGLLVLSEEVMKNVRASNDISKAMTNEYKKVKIKYAKKCMDKVLESGNESTIECAIDILREDNNSVSIKDISDASGMSVNTVRKYVELMADRLDSIDGFRVVRNKITETIDDNLNKIREAKIELLKEGVKPTKINLHKFTGVSRPTIDKYWNKI